MKIEISTKVVWGLVFVALLVISFLPTQFGMCHDNEYRCAESLLDVWRGIMMLGSMIASVLVMLFGVLEVHK